MAGSSARLLQVPFVGCDIFIDRVEDHWFIRGQLKQLVERAQRQGYAASIAHTPPVT